MVMYQNRNPAYNRFDVIDLDPYGSCSIFLDGAGSEHPRRRLALA